MMQHLVAVVLLCSALSMFGADARAASRGGEAAAIAAIRARYAEVRKNIGSYAKVTRELTGKSAEGGTLVGYTAGSELVHMVATHYGETGRVVEEYYFSGGALVFVFTLREFYDAPLSGRVQRRVEDRRYFHGGAMIRWIDENGKRVPPGGKAYARAERESAAAAVSFRSLLARG